MGIDQPLRTDIDRQVFTDQGCVGLFAEPDLTPTPRWRHLIDAKAKRGRYSRRTSIRTSGKAA